jgi:hypothetical protein
MFDMRQTVEIGVILVDNVAALHGCLYIWQVRALNNILWKARSQEPLNGTEKSKYRCYDEACLQDDQV